MFEYYCRTTICEPATPLQGVDPEGMNSDIGTATCIATWFTTAIAMVWNQLQCPLTDKHIKKQCYPRDCQKVLGNLSEQINSFITSQPFG